MLLSNLEVGATIPVGTIVLLTSGSYSDYSVMGIFRADLDVIVPGKTDRWHRGKQVPDTAKLSIMLTELDYVEVWHDY